MKYIWNEIGLRIINKKIFALCLESCFIYNYLSLNSNSVHPLHYKIEL